MTQKSRAEYFKERRKKLKGFSVLIPNDKYDYIDKNKNDLYAKAYRSFCLQLFIFRDKIIFLCLPYLYKRRACNTEIRERNWQALLQ